MSDRLSFIWNKALLIGCSLTVSLGIGLVMGGERAIAQITPDNTMGGGRSHVTPNVQIRGGNADRIDGGVRRGSNLFHSFQRFNVNEGQRVYFADSAGVETILGRVTGRNISNIRGTLGVAGSADLYLINPNGFIFGPNARLDIRGSFTASTADRFSFGSGRFFSAFNPQAPPLLTVNVPIGLQYNPGIGRGNRIVSQGNLIAGQDLTLQGGFFNLTGQLRAGRDLSVRAQGTLLTDGTFTAGRNLTLQAQGLLQLSGASVATAGRNMRLQGNGAINVVGAQSSPLPQLTSGGNLSLLSDGVVTTDAQLNSAGNLVVQTLTGEPGYWVNWQNVVSAEGDVNLGNYTGPSLQVRAGGNISYGRVVINALDPALNPTYPVFALNAGGRITSTAEASSTPTLPGLIVSLVSQGDMTDQRITTRGGPISLLSRGGSIGNSNLTSGTIVEDEFYVLEEYEGGAIALSAAQNINSIVSNSFSRSMSDDSGNGGIIVLSAGHDIFSSSKSFSTSGSGDSGNGGMIFLSAGHDISSGSESFSTSGSGNSGNGGMILLSASHDISLSPSLAWSWSYSSSGDSGNGGVIFLSAGHDISNVLSESSSGTFSSSRFGDSGDGGMIVLSAGRDISSSHSSSFSYSFLGSSSGDGGNITFSAGRDIDVVASLYSISYSPSGNSGRAGAISLTATHGSINENSYTRTMLNSFSIGQGSNGGQGGDVRLEAQGTIANLDILTLASSPHSGNVLVLGSRDLSINNVNILTNQVVQIPYGLLYPYQETTISLGQTWQSGEVNISSLGRLSLTDSRIESTTRSGYAAGNVFLSSPEQITIRNSTIASNTNNTGRAGDINLTAPDVYLINSTVAAGADSTFNPGGSGGNINLQGLRLLQMTDNSLILARASGSTSSGNINIDAGNGSVIGIPLQNNDIIAVANQGNGGRVEITADQVSGFIEQNGSGLNVDQLRNNRTNDISSISDDTDTSPEFEIMDRISFNDLAINPNYGLVELPTTPVDSSSNQQGQRGSPSDIVEAQGLIMDADGTVVLTANGSATTPHEDWRSPLNCTITFSEQAQ